MDLVNLAGIAQRLGVGRPTVANWAIRYGDFPAPLDFPGVIGIPLYNWPDVLTWARRRNLPRR